MTEQTQQWNRNYRLINQKTVAEIHSEVFIFEHIKTGAKLMYVKNDDSNKVFSISFKTPPEDHTGCPHILEHSVLNGSKNFPGKNTYTELCKGSVNTFLNAFTSATMTMYPFASMNEQDFYNLMHVYLDAVFYPNIYTNPDILKQEGWHYELFDAKDEITYKGVVYNEMKGAFSSPESVLMRKILHAQFPDTPYHYESGGDPQYIPELTWEKFKAFHKSYYHPSNSWIYLYGELDLEKALTFIDEKYLKDFEKEIPKSNIPFQTPFAQPKHLVDNYSIGADEDPAGKNFLSLSFTCGSILDVETTTALDTLKQILMDSAASPLKQAIQDSGMCADSYASFNEGILQPSFTIICKHVKDEDIEALTKLIFAELKSIADTGIDKKLIEATINSKEFALREADMNHFPKGLFYNWSSISSWMSGGDPLSYIAFEPIITGLRRGLNEPMYEQLILKHLLANTHSSCLILKPVKDLVEQNDEATRQILKSYQSSLNDTQIQALIADNKRLVEWQSTPDSVEDIEKIPFISLSDIKKEAEPLYLELENHPPYTLLKHPIFTNGIVYSNLYFDLNHIAEEDFPWVSLIVELWGNLDTQNYTYAALANEIDIHTGGISAELSLHNDDHNHGNINPKLAVSSKCVLLKTENMLELTAECLLKTKYNDTARIIQMIKEFKSRAQMFIIGTGHMTAVHRMMAQTSRYHRWQDLISGMDFYTFLCRVEIALEKDPQSITDKLQSIAESIFTKNNLLISITSPEEDIAKIWEKMNIITDQINTESAKYITKEFKPYKRNEGILAPVNVQYCAQGGNFEKLGYQYSGKMLVLANILRNDFLQQELRVKGGAYGVMLQFTRYGFMFFCSYRDPNLVDTFNVYKQTADYIQNFNCSERDFEKYIIGTMASLDAPSTPSQKGINADYFYISGLTFEDKQKMRDKVLSTKIEDIRGFAGLINDVMKLNQIAVFGVETKLKENSELFDVLIPAIPN